MSDGYYPTSDRSADWGSPILAAILILLAILGITGYSTHQKEQIARSLESDERGYLELTLQAKAERCFVSSYMELYVIGSELQTDKAEIHYRECIR